MASQTLFSIGGPSTARPNTNLVYTLSTTDGHKQCPKNVDVKHLEAWLRGPQEVQCKVTHAALGEYRIEGTPFQPGSYYIDVAYGGRKIFKPTDFTTELIGGDNQSHSLHFEMDGDGLFNARTRTNSTFSMKVRYLGEPTDIDTNLLEVLVSKEGDCFGAHVERQGVGHYYCTFRVEKPGEYSMVVRYKPENEYKEVLSQRVTFSDASHIGILFNIPTGTQAPKTTVRFGIQSRDSKGIDVCVGGDPWQATASGPDRVTHLLLTDQRNGTYTGEIIFPARGIYTVNVHLNGVPAEKSPFRVVIA